MGRGQGGQYWSVFCDGCVLGVFVVRTIVQAGSSVCTHRQVGPERRRGRGSVPGGAGYDQYTGSAT